MIVFQDYPYAIIMHIIFKQGKTLGSLYIQTTLIFPPLVRSLYLRDNV
jgi:hypothetical protein